MNLQIEKKYFAADGENSGVLDSDSAPFAVMPNSWVNMVNMRTGSTDKGVTETMESVGGTIAATPKSNFYRNVGKVEDNVQRRIIKFWHHTLTPSLDKIDVFDFDTQTTYVALLGTQITGGFNFSLSHPIHSAKVVGDLIYWTDDFNEPKKLNYVAAIKMNNPSFVTDVIAYTNPVEAEVDYIIRRPPAIELIITKTLRPSITVNNVADFAGQFAWRYLFRDGEKSVLSPISIFTNYNSINETGNVILVVANMVEHINQDVQQVDFCVRYGNSGTFFVINSWNKNSPIEAAQIAAHNAGTTGLNYQFLNDRIGIALDAAYSYKPFDSVPILSRALETALSRLLLGYNLSGFNTPTSTSLTYALNTGTTFIDTRIFKSDTDRKLGIIFRDRFKRVIGNVVTNNNLKIQIPDRAYAFSPYVNGITWNLVTGATAAAEIPVEAYYFEVVITKNLRTRFFVQARSLKAKYAMKDAVTGVISYQDTYSSLAYGFALDCTSLNAEGLGYLFDPASGDIAKIYKQGDPAVYRSAVVAQDGNYIIVKLQDLGVTTTAKYVFEVYTPYKEVGNEPFFTTGSTFPILNPGASNRDYGFTGLQLTGDVYLYTRDAPTGDPYRAENMASNPKYWKEWLGNWGEVNILLNSTQVRKKTAVQWSNVIVEGTQTNGLSSFDALDEKILPLDLGTLQKLQQTSKVEQQGNIVLAIGEQETASLYMGEVQVVGADQNAFLASAPSVIGTVNVLKGSFGTTMPTSVFEYRGNVYWLDINNGRVIQYSGNGLFPISNYKLTRFWKNWCEQFLSMTTAEIEALGSRPFVFTTVDPFHDELLLAIPKLSDTPPKGYLPDYPSTVYPFDTLDFQGKVMVYDLKNSRWLGSYTFIPDGFATLQNQLYSFTIGQMWLHNQFDNQCFFYLTQYQPSIMCVSNNAPTKPKVYHNVAVESNLCPTFMYFYNNYPIQQSSDLVDFSFRNVEGNYCANILRNKLVPTAIGYNTNGLLTAEPMRNVAMFIWTQWTVSGSNVLELKFLNIGFIPSLGNTTV